MKIAPPSSLSMVLGLILVFHSLPAKEAFEPAGAIPVAQEVDVVVVGGSSGGVAAAVAAAQHGARVFLAASRPYLGEDICASYRLWLEPGEKPTTELARLLFQPTPPALALPLGEIVVESQAPSETPPGQTETIRPVTPMHTKRTLDRAILDAGIPFLYASPVTDLLHDDQGKPAGIVLANRSGRQAVLAKVIVDATDRASVARLAGARFSLYPPETQLFSRTVVGGQARQGDNLGLISRPDRIRIIDQKGETLPVLEYRIQLPMPDDSFRAFAEAEQLARDWTWTKEAVDASEVLFQVPPDSFRSREPATGHWPGPDKISLSCFQPAGVERILVLGGCADLPRDSAAQLVRPVNLIAVGSRLGQAAAALARNQPELTGVRLLGRPAQDVLRGEVREDQQTAYRRGSPHMIPAEAYGLPLLGEYDVVVVGGGTGGAPAGIGAGRQGAKTLLIEYLHGLGGVGTLGYISTYYHGNRVGFTREVDEGVAAFEEKDPRTSGHTWNPEHKSEWYRRALRKAGVEIWYGTLGTGALVESNRVTGVIVVTPHGRGVVRAKVVVDSTGNADIAAAAGAACRYTDETDVAVQGTGLPPRQLGQRYTNTDYTFVDDTDIYDIWRVLVTAKEKFKGAYDLGQLIDTRERRQIVGDLTLSPMDMILGRTHPDTIVIARSNFDSHGYVIHPLFMIRPPDRADIDVRVPYRCLLPRGLDGILVTGLGISAHRDAIPVIRMQPDVQNQGYASGVAAALVARQSGRTRELDIKVLQRHLVEKGILPQSVLAEVDSFPLPQEKVATAVHRVGQNYEELEIVLAQFDTAQPLLRQALAQSPSPPTRLVYAHILGMMGDASGASALAQAVTSTPWDQGWRYTGMGQFGPSMSQLDSLIIALSRTRSALALKPILEKLSQLDAKSEFSHFRAVAIALETLGDPSAAQPLAELLRKPGLSGHAVTTIQEALQDNPGSDTDTTTRNKALSELYLARALYRCHDHAGLGQRILQQYAKDLHGHYARHAQAVLTSKSK